MLSRRITPSLDGAFFCHTARAFQKQLLTLSPTQPTDGTAILCHCSTSGYRTSPPGCAQQFSCIRLSRHTPLAGCEKSLFSPAQPRRAETHLSPSGVLASLRGSTYRSVLLSPLRSLRPCWTAFLSILRGVLLLS